MTTTDLLPLTADELHLHEVNVDAALILDEVFDLQPLEGWDDEDGYEWDAQ